MNKSAILLALSAFAVCSCAQNSGALTTISGKWERSLPEKMYLYKLTNGDLTEIASSSIDEDSAFYFANKLSEGNFYYIGPGKAMVNRYAFYLKPGDNLNFTVTEDSYTLNDDNSPENREVANWHDFIQPLEWKAVYVAKNHSTYKDFFPLFEEKLKYLETHPQNPTNNQDFNRIFEKYKAYNLLDIAIRFIYTPRSEHPESKDFPTYYHNLNVTDWTQTAEIIKYYPSGTDIIERIIVNNIRLSGQKLTNPVDFILKNITQVTNDTLKGELVAKYAATKRTYAELLDFKQQYGKYLVTENQKNKFRESELALNEPKDNNPATDFRFADKDGKQVALSDFGGKLVYIDIWATWCGPCRREFPHLKKLEAEYHNNENIVFLGISIDVSKDHQKWKDFLVKEDLKGIQLFGGDESRAGLSVPYKVTTIPRFILVGKDGKIISSDAPRPSSAEIRPLLKAYL